MKFAYIFVKSDIYAVFLLSTVKNRQIYKKESIWVNLRKRYTVLIYRL